MSCSTAFFISGASQENVIPPPQTLSESFTDPQEKTYDAQCKCLQMTSSRVLVVFF
ncbi:unnamed protein product [Trichobilharzia regenti]|nr:unnamed protein product [Trichobilharzia regenti]